MKWFPKPVSCSLGDRNLSQQQAESRDAPVFRALEAKGQKAA